MTLTKLMTTKKIIEGIRAEKKSFQQKVVSAARRLGWRGAVRGSRRAGEGQRGARGKTGSVSVVPTVARELAFVAAPSRAQVRKFKNP